MLDTEIELLLALLNTYVEDAPPERRERLRGRDAARMRALRDAIRAALRGKTNDLNAQLEKIPLLFEVTKTRAAFVPLHARGRLADAALAVVRVFADEHARERLRLCDECGWAFFDRSRPGKQRFCCVSPCANRARVRAFRESAPNEG